MALVLVCWGLSAPWAAGQETAVQLQGETLNAPDVLQRNATALLSEFSRATRANRRPILADLIATDAAQTAILDAWEQASFYCTQREVARPLVRRRDGTYELRAIPLVVEGKGQQEAVLTFNTDGKVSGFAFAGDLVVHTVPGEASVENPFRRNASAVPARFESLPAGRHRFEVRKKGYRGIDTTLTVTAGTTQRDTLRLQPGYGYVRLRGAPTPLSVQVGSTQRAVEASDSLRLRAEQEHTVTLSKRYYRDRQITVRVGTGETEEIPVSLQRKQTPVSIQSTPGGASVAVRGAGLEEAIEGTTPFRRELAAGRMYEVRVSKGGYVPAVREVAVGTDSTMQRTIALKPKRSMVVALLLSAGSSAVLGVGGASLAISGDGTVGVSSLAVGSIAGPALGQFYARSTSQAWWGVGIRVAGVLVALGGTAFESDVARGAFIVSGYATTVVSGIYDIVTVTGSVSDFNRVDRKQQGQMQAQVGPAIGPSNQVGLGLKVQF